MKAEIYYVGLKKHGEIQGVFDGPLFDISAAESIARRRTDSGINLFVVVRQIINVEEIE